MALDIFYKKAPVSDKIKHHGMRIDHIDIVFTFCMVLGYADNIIIYNHIETTTIHDCSA